MPLRTSLLCEARVHTKGTEMAEEIEIIRPPRVVLVVSIVAIPYYAWVNTEVSQTGVNVTYL